MSGKQAPRKKRNWQPDLDRVASATEYTGVLPAQREEDMPDTDEAKGKK